MKLVLDAGAISALAGQRARLAELRRRDLWPPELPSVVLAEALTGDHRRDVAVNRLLKTCLVRPVDEPTAREAARLRTATGRAGTISAVDAIVVASTAQTPGPAAVLTGDTRDIADLAVHAMPAPAVIAVEPPRNVEDGPGGDRRSKLLGRLEAWTQTRCGAAPAVLHHRPCRRSTAV